MKRRGVPQKTIDVQRLARALSGPGNDTRVWMSQGTVGIVDLDGEFVTTPESVWVDRLGVVVSVRLEPIGEVVTARYNGIACGRFGRMLIPVRPGDEVGVSIPDGDFNSPGITIVSIGSNATALNPKDWNNDRVLFDLNVPIEIRGPAIKINSPNLRLNGRPLVYSPEGV